MCIRDSLKIVLTDEREATPHVEEFCYEGGIIAVSYTHLTGVREERDEGEQTTTQAPKAMYAARIAVYDDMLSTPVSYTHLDVYKRQVLP